MDIDLVGNTVSFQRSIVEGIDGPVLVPTKTCRSHQVALDDVTADSLRAFHRQEVNQGRGGSAQFIFSDRENGERPWLPHYATKRFIRYRKAVGLPQFRLHDLRHFMATQMLDAGVPIIVVAERLAHARASTTLNVYAHAVPGSDRAAAQLLRSCLSADVGNPGDGG
jgi:integrase